MEQPVDLPRQLGKRFGAPAVLRGLMQAVGNFKSHRNLGGESAGTANILLRDARFIEAIEHAEHSQQPSLGAQ